MNSNIFVFKFIYFKFFSYFFQKFLFFEDNSPKKNFQEKKKFLNKNKLLI